MQIRQLIKDDVGFGIIEAAVLLPILLIIVFASIDFGRYFSNQAIAQRAISVVTNNIQTTSPNSTAADAAIINTNLNNLISSLGLGISKFTIANLCGKAFATQGPAQSFVNGDNPCAASQGFAVGRADINITPQRSYYVGVVATIPFTSIGLGAISALKMPKQITAKAIVLVPPAMAATPPICNEYGKVLRYDGKNWLCQTVFKQYKCPDHTRVHNWFASCDDIGPSGIYSDECHSTQQLSDGSMQYTSYHIECRGQVYTDIGDSLSGSIPSLPVRKSCTDYIFYRYISPSGERRDVVQNKHTETCPPIE